MKLSIGRRIGYGFGLALVLVFVFGAVGAWTLHTLDEAYRSAIDVHRGALSTGLEVNAQTRAARASFLNYVITQDQASLVLSRDALHQARAIVDRLIDSEFAEAEAWRRVSELMDQFERSSDDLVAAMEAGDPVEAERIRESEEYPAQRALDEAIQSALAGDLARSEELMGEADRVSGLARNVVVVGVLLIVLVGGGIAYLLARAVTGPLRSTSTVLGSSAAQILAATTQQATGATQTLAAVTETAATVDEVAQTAEHAADQAREVATAARSADEIGQRGRSAIERSVDAVTDMEEQVASIGDEILKLTEQTKAISEIITTVTDMAEQTNLLALNAAIEAARAGEQGRGFAVVAGEVRKLAEESKRATVRVRQILGEIQSATGSVVMVTEQGSKRAEDVTRLMRQAGEEVRSLTDAVTGAAQAAAQIAASTNQQTTGVSQIREAIHSIREAAQQNLSATRQAEAASRDLNTLGTELMELIGTDPNETRG